MKKTFVCLLFAGLLGFGQDNPAGPTAPNQPKTSHPAPQGPIEDPNAPQHAPGAPAPDPKPLVPNPNKPIEDPNAPGMPKPALPAPPTPAPATPPGHPGG